MEAITVISQLNVAIKRQPLHAKPAFTPSLEIMQRLKRVFNIDIEACEHCGGQVQVIASIEDPAVIEHILRLSHTLPAFTATGGTTHIQRSIRQAFFGQIKQNGIDFGQCEPKN